MSYGNSTAAAGLSTDVATANGTNTPTLPKTSELPDDILARARVYAYDLGIALPEEDLVQVFTLPPNVFGKPSILPKRFAKNGVAKRSS